MAKGKTAGDYAIPVEVVIEGTPVSDVLRLMNNEELLFVAVTAANGNIVGVLSATDLIAEMDRNLESSRLLEGRVEHVMRAARDMHFITEETIMLEVVQIMRRHNSNSLVVLNGLIPRGVIQRKQILKWYEETYLTKKP